MPFTYHCKCPNCDKQVDRCECKIRSLPPKFIMGPLSSDLLTLSNKVQQIIEHLNKKESE